MRKTVILFIAFVLLAGKQLRADEGMWLLPLIEKLAYKDMKQAGFKLTAQKIYDINSSSMKDAVVIFGGGCTGELISDQGLVLTNHHCGYGAIQQHSSVEHNYLEDGFVAHNKAEELYTPGLNVTFLDRIEDVTAQLFPLLQAIDSEAEREKKEVELMEKIRSESVNNNPAYRAMVTPMFGGNSYYLFVYKVYRDVRMVFAPPSSIGKFGADTDNWMWTRHTGDFSMFRVYGDADGNPASYSSSNVPLKPKTHFPISLKGFKEGDFAMVLGFPGRTQRYMTSWEVAERIIENDNRINVRGVRQELMLADMLADPKVQIQYASKYSGSSNYWKNSIGMNKAIAKLGIVAQKQAQEKEFTNWLVNNSERKAQYAEALPLIESAVVGRKKQAFAQTYLSETIMRGTELSGFGRGFIPLYEMLKKEKQDSASMNLLIDAIQQSADNFFKDYNLATDKKITVAMLKLYANNVDKADQAAIMDTIATKYRQNFEAYTDYLFANTFMTDPKKVAAFLKAPSIAALEQDPAFQLAQSSFSKFNQLQEARTVYDNNYKKGHRLYIAGLQEMRKGIKNLYPDANFTMRMTYGNILGYAPADAQYYNHITTLKGVMEKEDPSNWEFVVPAKLKELYAKKDFGKYAAKDGTMPVNFIFNGDITGGNSGSPVLNAKGELIGTAFDGNWEAMSGDITFETQLQRCINVDIRYTLFVVDKFAGAGYLLDEMTIVK